MHEANIYRGSQTGFDLERGSCAFAKLAISWLPIGNVATVVFATIELNLRRVVGFRTITCSSSQFESFAPLPFEHRICLRVSNDGFSIRVPFYFFIRAKGNVSEVANRCTSVLTFKVGNRRFVFCNAINKIPHVVDDAFQFASAFWPPAIVEFIKFEIVARKWVRFQLFDGFASDGATIDEEPPIFSMEKDAVSALITNRHFDIVFEPTAHPKVDRNIVGPIVCCGPF